MKPLPLPPFTVARDDSRERAGAVEPGAQLSAEWARRIKAQSNKAWKNAAKLIAHLAADHPDARYVEGWSRRFGAPEWHAWVDVPLAGEQWVRIDPSPSWYHMVAHVPYGSVLEVRAADLAPLVCGLLEPRGRATCRLPVAPFSPPAGLMPGAVRTGEPFERELGPEAHARSDRMRARVSAVSGEAHRSAIAQAMTVLGKLGSLRVRRFHE